MISEDTTDTLNQKLAQAGLRSTRQREVVYEAILNKRDHPTADEIFARVKQKMPSISLATVYNCLDTLVHCDLVKQVNLQRESTRYCPNLSQHAHFHDNESGEIFDVQLDEEAILKLYSLLPEGFTPNNMEVTIRGRAEKTSTTNGVSEYH